MSDSMRPNTAFLLMAQYNGAAVIPLQAVCRDYFSHLTVETILQKILRGDIKLPVVRMEHSRKSARGVHLSDLAEYLDKRRDAALKELRQIGTAA